MFVNKKAQMIFKAMPFIIMLLVPIAFWVSGKEITVEALLAYKPDNYILAAAFILFLYAVKSLSGFLPVILLNILTAAIFPALPAFLLNTAGIALSITIPYWIGVYSGSAYAEKLTAKHPKVKELVEKQHGDEWFTSFILRVIPLSCDMVSIYLGFLKIPFHKYFIAGLAGSLPGIISATLVGSSISDPFSPRCIISVASMLLLSIASFVIYRHIKKVQQCKNDINAKLEYMRKKVYRAIFRKRVFTILLLIMQLAFIVYAIISGSQLSVWIEYALKGVSVGVLRFVISDNTNSEYKLMWVILILILPVFGGLFYILMNCQSPTRYVKKKLTQSKVETNPLFYLPEDRLEVACKEASEYASQMRYLQKYAGFPIYGHTQTKYLPLGETKFEHLLEALKKAERYIFLEYFIIQEGFMWDAILEVLKEKASDGVDVRVLYDDVGCFFLLPTDYPQQLEAMGIQCAVFNAVRPVPMSMQNNRDHRKIAVIDGKTAFTGGINLADEYINAIEKHGHWKDSAIMLEGEAAWSFTLMFLQMWDVCKKASEDIVSFYPWQSEKCGVRDDGLAQPYTGSPMDNERISEQVYLHIINKAKDYIYITTPYLIIDDKMTAAMSAAAKGGVDVRVLTPHNGDKWYVHMMTRSYYLELIKAGVKVYEYSKGFIHSKTFVSDDKTATVGTANLDYRSLYLNFECGVWMYKSRAVAEIHDDFMQMLKQCEQINEHECKKFKVTHVAQRLLRLFAPFM